MTQNDTPSHGPDDFAIAAQYVDAQAVSQARRSALSDLDVWNVRDQDGWRYFDGLLPQSDHPRAYRMPLQGGAIMATGTTAMLGLFELGGQCCAIASPDNTGFPYNIFTADDDIGPVGMAGLEGAKHTSGLSTLNERTAAALAAETLLSWSAARRAALPLFYVRTETDSATSPQAVASGNALKNLGIAVGNWLEAAAQAGLTAELCTVILDIAGDDISSTAEEYVAGVLALLDVIKTQTFSSRLARAPKVISVFDSGGRYPLRADIIHAQWQLSLDPGDHDYCVGLPGYMLARQEDGLLNNKGRLHKAEMIAAALSYVPPPAPIAATARPSDPWHCPTILHAEWDETDGVINVICRALGPLVLDTTDPFGAGPNAGFQLIAGDSMVGIVGVSLSPDDPQCVQLKCTAKPTGEVYLAYASASKVRHGRRYPTNCGALRDDWQMKSTDGTVLHRWALPCHLRVTGV